MSIRYTETVSRGPFFTHYQSISVALTQALPGYSRTRLSANTQRYVRVVHSNTRKAHLIDVSSNQPVHFPTYVLFNVCSYQRMFLQMYQQGADETEPMR